jgi:TctA family transporter
MNVKGIPIWDDYFCVFHTGLGFVAGYVPILAPVIVLAFIAYQILEDENLDNKIGDLIEFVAGYILGSIVLWL